MEFISFTDKAHNVFFGTSSLLLVNDAFFDDVYTFCLKENEEKKMTDASYRFTSSFTKEIHILAGNIVYMRKNPCFMFSNKRCAKNILGKQFFPKSNFSIEELIKYALHEERFESFFRAFLETVNEHLCTRLSQKGVSRDLFIEYVMVLRSYNECMTSHLHSSLLLSEDCRNVPNKVKNNDILEYLARRGFTYIDLPFQQLLKYKLTADNSFHQPFMSQDDAASEWSSTHSRVSRNNCTPCSPEEHCMPPPAVVARNVRRSLDILRRSLPVCQDFLTMETAQSMVDPQTNVFLPQIVYERCSGCMETYQRTRRDTAFSPFHDQFRRVFASKLSRWHRVLFETFDRETIVDRVHRQMFAIILNRYIACREVFLRSYFENRETVVQKRLCP